jgi:hypothetical protein
LTVAEVAIFAFSFRWRIRLVVADYMFAGLLICAAVSVAINDVIDPKEWLIFLIALAAYPACRLVTVSSLPDIRRAFLWITGAVAVAGTIVAAQALAAQWDEEGRPVIFGFFSAPTMFLGSSGLFLIALTTIKLTARRTAVISASIFLPVAVFAASQIRFTFIAIIGCLCLSAFLAHSNQRKYIKIIGLVVLAGIAAGQAVRIDSTRIYLQYAVEQTHAKSITTFSTTSITTLGTTMTDQPTGGFKAIRLRQLQAPSCGLDVNLRNSIAIRKALLSDALYLVPRAGGFGFGLDSFLGLSCIPFTEVHDTILQAFVEFGWLGGICLLALILSSAMPLRSASQTSDDVRFVLCCLAYFFFLSLAHGRISRDMPLFAMLGLAAGTRELVALQSRPAISTLRVFGQQIIRLARETSALALALVASLILLVIDSGSPRAH